VTEDRRPMLGDRCRKTEDRCWRFEDRSSMDVGNRLSVNGNRSSVCQCQFDKSFIYDWWL